MNLITKFHPHSEENKNLDIMDQLIVDKSSIDQINGQIFKDGYDRECIALNGRLFFVERIDENQIILVDSRRRRARNEKIINWLVKGVTLGMSIGASIVLIKRLRSKGNFSSRIKVTDQPSVTFLESFSETKFNQAKIPSNSTTIELPNDPFLPEQKLIFSESHVDKAIISGRLKNEVENIQINKLFSDQLKMLKKNPFERLNNKKNSYHETIINAPYGISQQKNKYSTFIESAKIALSHSSISQFRQFEIMLLMLSLNLFLKNIHKIFLIAGGKRSFLEFLKFYFFSLKKKLESFYNKKSQELSVYIEKSKISLLVITFCVFLISTIVLLIFIIRIGYLELLYTQENLHGCNEILDKVISDREKMQRSRKALANFVLILKKCLGRHHSCFGKVFDTFYEKNGNLLERITQST
jgi:hypothetical protein